MHRKNSIAKLNSTPTKKVNILMVDDHPENLLALEAVLISPNYHLVSANSGKEALKCMLKHDFAVILLDVQMPGLNGFETAKLIKAREKTRHIPIIFITAISQDMENVQQGYSVGAIDYIFKPFHPETLKQKIEQFVKIHKKHEENIIQSDLERNVELNEVNKKLDRTTLNLRRTEALAKVIGETLMDTIVTFDEQGFILSVNPAVKTMFGYEAEEIIGKNIVMLFLKMKDDNENKSSFSIFSSIKKAVGKVIESVSLRKDESYFPADIQIGETTVEDQQIFVCTIRDITERKQIEEVKRQKLHNMEHIVEERTFELLKANEKLQKEIEERNKIADHLYLSQERFRKIFESSPCLMAIFSLKDKMFIDINTSWVNIIGYSYEELVNKSINIQHFIDESDGSYIDLNQTIRNRKISYKTKNGEIRAGLLSTEMIDIHPEPCTLIVLTDITERVHLEKEMYRLDRLNLIGEMAAGIAHEIRNPMTTVHGFLQVTRNDRDNLPVEIVDLMLEELNRANSIITEFLNLAKNKVSVKMKHNLNTIIEALSPLIQAEALRSSKHIYLDLGKCPDIYLDQKEIRQLILNIALNGLDAMSSGGKLTIKTYIEERAVILEVKDQGSGISPEVLEKIGTPFFTTKEKGTGLGLAICYSVAERHHADIDIETGSMGTIFSIRFDLNHN
ncbi:MULTISPECIES: PAS domain S-box protein [Metabacillus]|uniref:histidine kinase n=2 Tax=Metabacillus TaxID=2675233 RepID=A0A179T7G7_9BACI|nr:MULTISPECIES: PAS domain S-box protein [Metabacillus]OAS88383.1 hybrid sensor histidine kinase/response regulator [Metabacillus litoralis]QNF28114.1 PAS domain S-box protein [Metabacillus sp. KUDC1714]